MSWERKRGEKVWTENKRSDGPYYIWNDGSKLWFEDDADTYINRINGPASMSADGWKKFETNIMEPL